MIAIMMVMDCESADFFQLAMYDPAALRDFVPSHVVEVAKASHVASANVVENMHNRVPVMRRILNMVDSNVSYAEDSRFRFNGLMTAKVKIRWWRCRSCDAYLSACSTIAARYYSKLAAIVEAGSQRISIKFEMLGESLQHS